MEKSGNGKNKTAGAKSGKENDQDNTSQVVMRKPRNVCELVSSDSVDSTDSDSKTDVCDDCGNKKKKHVKWSESTELRERLKVYRRSQLDIPLDYHHLAIEEKREREGVQVWRTHLKYKEPDDNDEDSNAAEKEGQSLVAAADVGAVAAATEACGGKSSDDTNAPDYDSDDTDPNIDEDLERKLQMIKEETTKLTLYPAYSAAISVYEEWLSNSDHTKQLSDKQLTKMSSQLNLYKRLVDIYKEWSRQTTTNIPRESRFGEITSILQEASNLGQPPSCVSKVIREVLTDEENIQKQVDAYNNQVQEMIAALDITKTI